MAANSSQSRLKKQKQQPSLGPLPPTTYYFAYGSNLHMIQMKRRCPNSKFIGVARLPNFRWHINQRGFANVRAADGYWVDGLVYEVDATDEANLDVCEGVSKNAYSKCHIRVLLHRARDPLYRRPVAWIVDQGGPTAVNEQAQRMAGTAKQAKSQPTLVDDVLIYLNLDLTQDSEPRKEYIRRINLGIADAIALGVDEDYVRNSIRPYVPEIPLLSPDCAQPAAFKTKPVSPRRGRKATTPSASREFVSARQRRDLSLLSDSKGRSRSLSRGRSATLNHRVKETPQGNEPPPLPSQSRVELFQVPPIIVVEEEVSSSSSRWWPLL